MSNNIRGDCQPGELFLVYILGMDPNVISVPESFITKWTNLGVFPRRGMVSLERKINTKIYESSGKSLNQIV